MSRIYTTAQGKAVDMEMLRAQNEETIAVGNMKVNARGDKLGAGGNVVETRNQTQDQYYKLNTPMPIEISQEERAAQEQTQRRSGARMSQGVPIDESAPVAEPVFEDPTPVAVEAPAEPTPKLRGSLASSLAPQATVKQELIKDPRKPTGPSRI
jgi:hypothetical protein